MRRWRWGVVLGSVAFHALLVLLVVLDLDRGPPPASPPPMTVWLERSDTLPRPRTPLARQREVVEAPNVATAEKAAPVPAVASGPASSSPSSPPIAAAADPAPSLRGLGGCRLTDLDRLSPEEQARCHERLAQGMADAATAPNLDPKGRYVRDVRPYLTQPPKDGCKPVGSVKQLPMGQTSVTLAGGCARSF